MENDSLEKLKLNLGLHDRIPRKMSEHTLGSLGIVSPEQEKGVLPNEIDWAIVRCVVGKNFIGAIRTDSRRISNEELDAVINIDEIAESESEKNYFIMQLYAKMEDRFDGKDSYVNNRLDIEKIKSVLHIIKTDYISSLRHAIGDIVKYEKVDYQSLKKILDLVFLKSKDFIYSSEEDVSKHFDYEADQEFLSSLIQGIRHEEAFKELVYEADGIMEVVETDEEQDYLGTDVILKTKLSKKKTKDGLYQYASSGEVESGRYEERAIRIDVKSNPYSSKIAKFNEVVKKNPSNLDHWVMWSNVYNEDFRLSMIDGVPGFGYDPKNGAVYLKLDEQIAAMRGLNRASIYYVNQYGEKIIPPTLDDRIINIKREVLRGINTLPASETDLSIIN